MGVIYGAGIFFTAVVEALTSDAPFNKLAAHVNKIIEDLKENKESK